MKDKNINIIDYNYLNLPNRFFISQKLLGKNYNTDISHLYGADGTKRRTIKYSAKDGDIGKTNIIDYLDGFQYRYYDNGLMLDSLFLDQTSFAYEEQAYARTIGDMFSSKPKWQLDFVPTSEGFYSFTENRYIYQYKDHLGNTRVSFAKNSAGALEVIDTNNYYPFGLNHIGGVKGQLGSYKNYKYNGKELQETGMYDYGARMYMPDLGRWGVVDPLAEKMTRHSPYNYAYNNPIRFIDPDGRKPEHIDPSKIFDKNKDGSYKNPKLVQAWNQFATSKDGQNFLKDYASPGQVVAGHKYSDAGGKYDKAGIDLSFDNGKALTNRNSDKTVTPANGITSTKEENGRINFQVSITDGKFIDRTLETLTHELGVHVKLGTADYFDNKKFDFSTGYESIAKDGYTQSYLNKHYGPNSGRSTNTPDHLVNDKTNQAYKLGSPIIKALYQKYNINGTDAQIKNLYNN